MKNIKFIRRSRLPSLATTAKAILIVSLFALSSELKAQTFMLSDDNAITGPYQKVSTHVVYNDLIPCSDYTLSIVSSSSTEPNPGTVAVKTGGFVEYAPGESDIPPTINDTTEVSIIYKVECGTTQHTATLTVRVTKLNNPSNVIPADVACYDNMPSSINFGTPRSLWETSTAEGSRIDGLTSPMVGDLNGDGKPEVVMMGVNTSYLDAAASQKPYYINIYNGQNGARLVRYELPITDRIQMGSTDHRAPSQLALVDIDNNGLGEIIVAFANGQIRCYKPDLISGTFSGSLTQVWTANVNYGRGTTAYQYRFGYPHPYVADINGDGIPELIIYNKIYNAQSGKLLLEWGGPGTNLSSKTSGALTPQNFANPSTPGNAGTLRGLAMTGRRPGGANNNDYLDSRVEPWQAVPAIVDIDGDGKQEVITGMRIHKFDIINLEGESGNTYTTIDGPTQVTIMESSSTTYGLSDGFTRVADIDGDGKLDIIVATVVSGATSPKILLYVWSYDSVNGTHETKAAITYNSAGTYGCFSIPFVGDINGFNDGWDGQDFTRKLPEICILSGKVSIDRSGRSGIPFHEHVPFSSNLRTNTTTGFNGTVITTPTNGHIIGLTYNAKKSNIYDRLELSWAMGHQDRSNVTGITLFDFDNNGSADLCYRDETTLRVISPAKASDRYITSTADALTPGSGVMFSTKCYSGTGFEYPTIADVNMDGSADILVTNNSEARCLGCASGQIKAYQYQAIGPKWAPCPPVWNQSMYDPTQVRENLQINARPISMLTKYYSPVVDDTIQPYNGSWMQRPIIKAGDDYRTVVRLPDAVVINMTTKVASNGMSDTINLTILNRGTASISASTPISFYDGDLSGLALESSPYITQQEVGVDIFPNEIKTIERIPTITSGTFSNHLIWARVMANNNVFPALGFKDCDLSNNAMAAIDCPYLLVKTSVFPSNTICGPNTVVKLSVTNMSGGAFSYQHTPVFQWYRNNVAIPAATDSVLYVSEGGDYNCYVQDNICRTRTNTITVTVHYGDNPPPALNLTGLPSNGYLCRPSGTVIISADNVSGYINPKYYWYKDNHPQTGQTSSSLTTSTSGLYRLDIVTGGTCMVSDTFRVTQTDNTVPSVTNISAPAQVCAGTALSSLTTPSITSGDHNKNLRYHAVNYFGTGYSNNIVQISVADKPTVGRISTPGAVCVGNNLVMTPPDVDINNATVTTKWQWETGVNTNSYEDKDLPFPVSMADNGKRIYYYAANSCDTSYSDTVVIDILVCTDLFLTATVPENICENAIDTFYVKVKNRATVQTAGLSITEVFPSGNLTLLSSYPNKGTYDGNVWSINELAAGDSAQLKLAVRGLSAGTSVQNQVYVSAVNGSNYASYDAAETRVQKELAVKSTPVVTVRPGGNICIGDTVHLFHIVGGTTPWTLSYSDGTNSRTLTLNASPYVFQPSVTGDSTFTSVSVVSANGCDSASTATTTISTGAKPSVARISVDAVCSGNPLTSGGQDLGTYFPSVAWNNSLDTSKNWMIEREERGTYQTFDPAFTVNSSDKGKRIYYAASNSCGTNESDTATVEVWQNMTYPDIRIQLCPEPSRSIFLSGYLDTLNFRSVEWSAVSNGSPSLDPATGALYTGNLTHGVHVYKYHIENECGEGTARAFVKNTTHPQVRSMSDTLIVCQCMPLSAHLQLNQMLGLEAGGTWSYDNELSTFVAVATEASQFVGARIFNASAAWSALKDDNNYKFTYGNDYEATRFKFVYTTPQDSCLGSIRRELVLIVTCIPTPTPI